MNKITSVVIWLSFASCSLFQPKYTSGLEGQSLPDFPITLLDSAISFQTASIPKGQSFILFLYRPDCSFCQAQTRNILDHISQFHHIPIYLISTYSYNSIKQYSNYFHLNLHPDIILARDSTATLLDYFKSPPVPYLAFYDAQKKLKQVLVGQTPFAAIQKILSDLSVGQLASIP